MYILRFIKTRFNASPVFKPPFMQTIPLTMHRLWYILSLIYFTLEILYIMVFIICLHCQGPPVIEIRLGCWFYSKFFVYVFLNHNVLCQIYISVWYILKQLLPVNFHLLKNTFTEQLSAEGTVQGPESTPARKNGEQKPRNYSSWMWSHLNKRNLFLIASIYAEQVNKNCPIDRNWFAVSHPHWLNRLWHTRFELGRSL